MVDLTPEPGPLIVSKAPTSGISPQQVAQPYQELSGAMEKSADALMQGVAVPAAKKAAADDLINQKIIRNADGSVTVANPATAPLLFGDAANAYRDAAAAGTIAQHGNEVSQKFA